MTFHFATRSNFHSKSLSEMARTKRAWKKNWGGKFQANDLASCRGRGIFLATCQSAKEREASRELVTLITDVIEELYPADPADEEPVAAEEDHSVSVEEMIRREVETAKGGPNQGGKNNALAQKAVSISTDIKGIVIIKLARKAFCPVQILSHIMQRIERERAPLTRFVVRLIPLQITFFPKDEDLAENIPYLLHRHLPGIELPHLKRRLENQDEQSAVDDHNNDGDVAVDAKAEVETEAKITEEENSNEEGEHAAAKKQRLDEVGTSAVTAIPPDFEKIVYCIEYKGRSHDVLNREKVFVMFNQRLRDYGVVDYMNPKVQRSMTRPLWPSNSVRYRRLPSWWRHSKILAVCLGLTIPLASMISTSESSKRKSLQPKWPPMSLLLQLPTTRPLQLLLQRMKVAEKKRRNRLRCRSVNRFNCGWYNVYQSVRDKIHVYECLSTRSNRLSSR